VLASTRLPGGFASLPPPAEPGELRLIRLAPEEVSGRVPGTGRIPPRCALAGMRRWVAGTPHCPAAGPPSDGGSRLRPRVSHRPL